MVVVDLCSLIATFATLTVGYYIARYLWELLSVGDLHKKAVFVSGCDSGFGRALALKCAKNGITVFAGCLTKKGEESLSAEASGRSLFTMPLDVTKDDSVAAARAYVDKNLPKGIKLWAVVANAGVFTCYGPDDWCSIEDYRFSVEVNTFGVVRCVQAFMDLIKASEGRIVAVSSVAGRNSVPMGAPYAVSKYGVQAYMDAIRMETYLFGVKVSILEPGVFKTNLIDKEAMNQRVEKVWAHLSDKKKAEWGEDFKNFFKNEWNETFHAVASTDINYVVDNYYHAITGLFPRHRYPCGWDAIFFWIPISFVDSRIADALFRLVAGKKKLPAALEKKKH